jgi:hypothetical protein
VNSWLVLFNYVQFNNEPKYELLCILDLNNLKHWATAYGLNKGTKYVHTLTIVLYYNLEPIIILLVRMLSVE